MDNKLIIESNVKFEEYARRYDIEEIELGPNVTSIDGGGIRECYSLTSLTIWDTFYDMGSLAFASTPIEHLIVKHSETEYTEFHFGIVITGNDIMNIISSLKHKSLVGNFSKTGVKYVLMLKLYDLYPTEVLQEKIKKAIIKIASFLIDTKNTRVFLQFIKHTELFDEKNLFKIKEYAKSKKNIKEIKQAIDSLYNEFEIDDKNNKESNDDNTHNDIIVEKGKLIAIGKGPYDELIVPEGVKEIEKEIFESVKIKKLILPSTLVNIKSKIFKDSIGISEIVLSEGTENIYSEAFKDCTSLKYIKFPSTLKLIQKNAFRGCSSLSEILIPENLETIGEAAFARCTKLREITIPKSVSSFGTGITYSGHVQTFIGCKSLKSVHINGDLFFSSERGGDVNFESMFKECDKLSTVTINSECKKLAEFGGAIYSKSRNKLKELLYIPNNLTHLELPTKIIDKYIRIDKDIQELTINTDTSKNIDINIWTTSISKLNIKKDDKIYNIDLNDCYGEMFSNYDLIGEGLYPQKKQAIKDLIDDIITLTLCTNFKSELEYLSTDDQHCFGETRYYSTDCGTPFYPILFDLRTKLSHIFSEIHNYDETLIGKALFRIVIEENEYDIKIVIVNEMIEYFARDMAHIFFIEDYPDLFMQALTKAIEYHSKDLSNATLENLKPEQVLQLIEISSKLENVDATAILMDFMNKKFPNFDIFDTYTID